MAEMAKDSTHQKRLTDIGSIAVASTPSKFEAIIREDTERWDMALKTINIDKK